MNLRFFFLNKCIVFIKSTSRALWDIEYPAYYRPIRRIDTQNNSNKLHFTWVTEVWHYCNVLCAELNVFYILKRHPRIYVITNKHYSYLVLAILNSLTPNTNVDLYMNFRQVYPNIGYGIHYEFMWKIYSTQTRKGDYVSIHHLELLICLEHWIGCRTFIKNSNKPISCRLAFFSVVIAHGYLETTFHWLPFVAHYVKSDQLLISQRLICFTAV